MSLSLEASDIATLTAATQAAIVDGLVLVIAADREVSPEEIEAFNREVHRIPWGLGPAVLDMLLERARVRLKCTPRDGTMQLWIKEIAMTVLEPGIREKVLFTMGRIALAAGETQTDERSVLNAFAGAFELTPAQLAAIRAQIIADSPNAKA